MGWALLAVIGIVAFVALRLIGLPRLLSTFAGAALMLGATGYALQQHAALPGHPVTAAAEAVDIDPGMVAFREMILRGTPEDARLLAAADAQLRRGETAEAARILLAAIAQRPADAVLWTGLGSALSAHDGGQLSPAARLAFRRAWQLAPDRPGPPFFLGQAFIEAGDMAEAKTAWLRALRLTPHDASYRVAIAERLVLIDQFQAMTAATGVRAQ